MTREENHISVCICTYKRPKLLAHLLSHLQNQTTDQVFTYSIVVVDNDYMQTARSLVESLKQNLSIDVDYYTEPEQNIAIARNKAIKHAKGNFIAFIDDDEFPDSSWLLNLYKAYNELEADGILGPVIPYYQTRPPEWIINGKFYERPSHKTGTVLHWTNARTGNVLLRRDIFDDAANLFKPEFGRGGEDREFFRRMISKGFRFLWCVEAPVYESVPPERFTRSFMLRRALLRGKIPHFNYFDIVKSLIAIPAYTLTLPFLFFLGHHTFMKYLVKTFDHIGRILASCGFDVIKKKYVFK